MWIEHSETKLAAYVNDAFIFSDLIMAISTIENKDPTKAAPKAVKRKWR